MNKAQIKLMIESLEELSAQPNVSLYTEQWELLDHLKKMENEPTPSIEVGYNHTHTRTRS
jgi:hypothetical protein